MPPLNALRAFEVAARHLNFRLAAEELGVTQGAVAQQVRGLEAHLGVQLFLRTGRSLVLTEAGRGYAMNLGRAFQLMAAATASLRPEPLRLTLSVPPSFAAAWLIPRLGAFTDSLAGIELVLQAADRMANFQADGVDLAVRLGRPPFGPGLHSDPLFEQELIAVAAPGARGLWLHDSHDLWPQFLALPGPAPSPPTGNLRFNQTALAIAAAQQGQGLALVPRAYVQDDLARGRLVQVLPQSLRTGADFHLVAPRKPRNPGPVDALRAWLRDQAAPRPTGQIGQIGQTIF